MDNDIITAGGRKQLTPRRDPYWHRLEAGQFIGFRKLDDGTGTWIARWRDDEGKQNYRALGAHATFDAAAREAKAWFESCEGGSTEVVTVAEACRRYVIDRRNEKGEQTAKDAEGRCKRHIYSASIGKLELSKLKTAHIVDWRNKLAEVDEETAEEDPDAIRRAKDTANRELANLKAALNLAYRMGLVSSPAQWDRVASFERVGRRRERFLTVVERKAFYAAASHQLKPLIRALLLTGARPGEIAKANVGDLDPAGLLTLDGKTGRRTVPVSVEALEHLTACAGERDADAPLIVRADGERWTRYYWRDEVQAARQAAGLPDDVVLYSLRHCAISEMLVGGIDPMTVARIAGTSVNMIQRHYGHLMRDSVVAKLGKIKMM